MNLAEIFSSGNRRQLFLRKGRERAMTNRHPWVFEGSIAREEGPATAAIGELIDARGRRIATGLYSHHSQIRLRALIFEDTDLSAEMIAARVERAIARRRPILTDSTNAVRLVNSEGDDLSGLVIDLYDRVAVVEITSAGLEQVREIVFDTLGSAVRPRRIVQRNDLAARKIERLSMEPEIILEEPAGADREVVIRENGLSFSVDPGKGQKTGFFLDQRENRCIAEFHSLGKKVLNLFSYSGAFGVYALRGGATSVQQVDVSASALALARTNHLLNGQMEGVTFVTADAFDHVRALASSGARFGLVVCDPPAFARSRGEVDRACRGYKDINLQALRLIESGGYLMTFSCSGHVSPDLFQKIVFGAALDARRAVAIVKRLGAGEDHPISIYCPEGEYLKGLLVQVLD